jgi:quercetin dioxygenase-like cupin family protein
MPIIALEELDDSEPLPGYVRKFIHTDKMTLATWIIKPGSPFPEHSHPHEQIMMVTDGKFELTLEGETRILHPGLVAVIPPNESHSGVALTECHITDIFSPVREEFG